MSLFLGLWIAIHLYLFWRARSIPWVASHIPLWATALVVAALAASYLLARFFYRRGWDAVALPLEYIGGEWVGVMFFLFCAWLAVDVITLFGFLFSRWAPMMRIGAAGVAGAISLLAVVQGVRPPVITDYEVTLKGLPRERDGLVVVVLSDLHLGALIGARWMNSQAERIQQMKPDMIVLAGDIIEGNEEQMKPLLPALRKLQAPLGVWAVAGNHENYGGMDRSLRLMEDSGSTVLRNRWAQAVPGLIMAGIEEQHFHGREAEEKAGPLVRQALQDRPSTGGATILLSHIPRVAIADAASSAGVGLMISGHTHGGQLWPFSYISKKANPLFVGQYEIGEMTLIVSRGAGTWGPRMRLWLPGEIVRIRLKAKRPDITK